MVESALDQQVRGLYAPKKLPLMVEICFAVSLAWAFYDFFPKYLLITGLTLKLVSVALQFVARYCYEQFSAWLSPGKWMNFFLLLLGIDGAIWSGLAMFCVPDKRPEFIVGTVAVIMGVGAVRTRILPPYSSPRLVFSGCLLAPAAVWHLYSGYDALSGIAALALFFQFALISFDAKWISADFKARFRLQSALTESVCALQESEGRWKAVYEFSPVSKYLWQEDAGDWLLVSSNPAAKALTKNRVEDLLGKRASQLYADSPEIMEALKACRAEKNLRRENLTYRLRSTGEAGFFHASFVFIPDRYVLVTTENISEKARSDQALRDSLREKEMLLAEVHHRVKNNLQVLASLISMQKNLVKDEASGIQLENLGLRVRAMGLLHTKLYRSNDIAKVDMQEYLSAIAEQVMSAQFHAAPEVELSIMIDGVYLNMETALPLGLITNEVIVNSLKHAFGGIDAPRISIILQSQASGFFLEMKDNGVGMLQDKESVDTLGLRLVRVLAKQIKGDLRISGLNGVSLRIDFFEQNKEEKRWIS